MTLGLELSPNTFVVHSHPDVYMLFSLRVQAHSSPPPLLSLSLSHPHFNWWKSLLVQLLSLSPSFLITLYFSISPLFYPTLGTLYLFLLTSSLSLSLSLRLSSNCRYLCCHSPHPPSHHHGAPTPFMGRTYTGSSSSSSKGWIGSLGACPNQDWSLGSCEPVGKTETTRNSNMLKNHLFKF